MRGLNGRQHRVRNRTVPRPFMTHRLPRPPPHPPLYRQLPSYTGSRILFPYCYHQLPNHLLRRWRQYSPPSINYWKMDRQLKVLVWNANGVQQRRNELHVLATDLDLDIILLCETHLQPQHRFTLPAYEVYRTDRPPRPQDARNPGGGSAVLVHRRITHRLLPNAGALEATSVAIQANGAEYRLLAVYSQPTAPFCPRDMDAILHAPGPVLIGGDLNAKHQSWNSRRCNARGNALRRYIDRRGDISVAAPGEPTHYPSAVNSRPDVLDIIVYRDVPVNLNIRALDELSSDHLPVFLTVETTLLAGKVPPTVTLKTDWQRFHSMLAECLIPPPPATTPAELDTQVNDLQGKLTEALNESTKPALPNRNRRDLPEDIKIQLRRRKFLRRTWQRTRNPVSKRQFNAQCALVKSLLDDYRTDTWNAYLDSLELEDGSAWKAAKILRGKKHASHPIHGQRGLAYLAHDKAEAFADTMEDQFQPHGDVYDDELEEEVEEFIETYFTDVPVQGIEPVTFQEVSDLVSRAKPRKAPGIDAVGARALQAAPPALLQYLLVIFNASLSLLYFPSSWKTAKIILLPKPNKSPLFPQNYRPISLLPTMSKILEKLLLTRIRRYIDDYIRPEQFGFREGHSTTLQLVRVVSKLADSANMNRATVAVLLDVSKAFDKVWHEGLLYKLSWTPIPPPIIHMLRSYLTNRKFKTCVEGELSSTRDVGAGVPQGSVLGPVLYLIYTNDMPVTREAMLSLYADDAMLMCSSIRPLRAARLMQDQLDALSPWLKRWRIKVNADKSEAVVFKKFRKMKRTLPPPVSLDRKSIPWKPSLKYLGVTLDRGLNFGAHARAKLSEARKIAGSLQPLLSYKCPLPLAVKVRMFMAIVRAVLMYAAPAWWAMLSKSNRKAMEACQSRGLRLITRQPWFVSNRTIRNGLKERTLAEYAKHCAVNLFHKAEESTHPHLQQLARREGAPESYRPRPQAILDDPP